MKSWIKGAIGVIGFFGIIIGYGSQSTHLSGYLDLAGLIKTGLLTGAMIGGVAGFVLHKKGKDQDARFSIYAGMLVLGIVTGPLVLSLINRVLSQPPVSTEYKLVSAQPVMQTSIGIIKGRSFEPDAHIVTMMKDEMTYTVILGVDLDHYLMDEDSITLNIRKGGLKYDYVDHRPTTDKL